MTASFKSIRSFNTLNTAAYPGTLSGMQKKSCKCSAGEKERSVGGSRACASQIHNKTAVGRKS